jgi:hypothetical protein
MIRLFCFSAIFLTFLPGMVSAKESARFQPVEFGAKKDSIVKKIHFPESYPGKPVEVFCEAQITMLGRVHLDFCYPAKHYDDVRDYVYAVWHAFHRVFLSSARVNGQRVVSHMQIRVRFEKILGEEHIEMYPNMGINTDLYGDDYIGAQYYWAKMNLGACDKYVNVVLYMHVGLDGRPRNIKLLNKGVSEHCTGSLVRQFKRRKFIPAFYQGKPVSSRYIGYMNLDPNVNTIFINLGVLIGRIQLESRKPEGERSSEQPPVGEGTK